MRAGPLPLEFEEKSSRSLRARAGSPIRAESKACAQTCAPVRFGLHLGFRR